MPITIRSIDPQVDTARLPGARLTPEAPAAAFGVAVPSPISAQAMQVISREVAEARRKATEVRLIDVDRQLADLENQLLYDPNTGALARRGEDAFSEPERVTSEWTKRVGEIGEHLTGEAAERFQMLVNRRHEGLQRAVNTHVAGEIRAHGDATTRGLVASETNAALANYRDEERLNDARTRIKNAIAINADHNGLPPEERDRITTAALSTLHVGVLDRITSVDRVGMDAEARAYYEKYKEEISGADRAKIERGIEEASLRGESQVKSDDIVNRAGSMTEALAMTKGIVEPRLRDAVRERVRAHYADIDAAERLAGEKRYLNATNIVDANPGAPARSVIPSGMWSQLSLEQRSALERRTTGADMPNNDQVWLQFLDMAPGDVGKLTQGEFETRYWSHLDREHRERAALMWDQAKDMLATGRRGPELTATLTAKDRIDNALRATGIISASKEKSKFTRAEAEVYANFETSVAREVELFEITQLKGARKATGEEVQAIVDRLVMERVFINRNRFFEDPQLPASAVPIDEHGKAYVPWKDIPEVSRRQIEQTMRKNGKASNRAEVQRAYAAVRMGNRKLYDELVGNTTPEKK